MPRNISTIQHSVVYGQTELFPVNRIDGDKKDNSSQYLLCCNTLDDGLKCDLLAVNEIYVGHNEHLGERKVVEDMQVIDKNTLCSAHARCVVASLHNEVDEDGNAKKGNFYVLHCMVPLVGEGYIRFGNCKTTKIWPVSGKKMKMLEVSTKVRAGIPALDPLGIASCYQAQRSIPSL